MHYTLCDCILDIFQNSVEADSSRIVLDLLQSESTLIFKLVDNGKGMDEETLKRVQDPFFTDGIKHKNRKVGLGIPFLKQTTDMTEGTFLLKSKLGEGTWLDVTFNLKHWDTPPIGDVVSLIISAMTFDGDYELIVNRENETEKNSYSVARSELLDVLGDLSQATNMILLKEFIESQEIDN